MTLLSERSARTPATPESGGIAAQLTELVSPMSGGALPFRLRAWDGSESGPVGTPVAILRSPAALRRLLWAPGELGLAQAYVTGELDVEGDLKTALETVWATVRSRGLRGLRPTPRLVGNAVRTARELGIV